MVYLSNLTSPVAHETVGKFEFFELEFPEDLWELKLKVYVGSAAATVRLPVTIVSTPGSSRVKSLAAIHVAAAVTRER